MSLYDAEGNDILGGRPKPEAPHVLSPPIPISNAMAGAIVVAQSDGMSMVWPLHPTEVSLLIMDFGDGPEPVVVAQGRRKYENTETHERQLAAVPHAEVPGWVADFYREGEVPMEGAPSMKDGALVFANMSMFAAPAPPPPDGLRGMPGVN